MNCHSLQNRVGNFFKSLNRFFLYFFLFMSHVIEKFIKNTKNEQLSFLVFFYASSICIFFYAFGLNPILFMLFFYFLSFLLYCGVSLIWKHSENSDVIVFILVCVFIFYAVANLYFQNYGMLLIMLILLIGAWYKSAKIPIIQKTSTFKDFSPFSKFLIDFVIIEYHFENEFWLFDYMRKINLIATFLFIRYFMWLFARPDNIYSIEFHTESQYIIPIFFAILVNFFLLMIIRLVIICYCNPPIAFTTVQKCLSCVGTLSLASLSFMGFHVISIAGVVEPLPIAVTYLWQHKILGYKFLTSNDALLAKFHLFALDKIPPLNEDKFIDPIATKKALATLSKVKLECLIEKIPYHLRPNLEGLTGIENAKPEVKKYHDFQK
jgi:hypothetical protein